VGDHEDVARRQAAWRYLWRLIKQERLGVACAAASGLTWQAAAVTAPLFVQQGLDDGVLAKDTHQLLYWSGALVLLGLVEAVAGGSRHFFAIRNRSRSDAAVRDELYTRALELDARFHDRVGAGELMSRASNDAELIARLLDSIGHTIGYVLTVFAVAVILLLIDLPLGLVVLLPLPLVSIGFWRYSARYRRRTKVLQEELAAATALVEESVSGVRVVKGLGAGNALAKRFRAANDRVVARALDVAALDAVFLPALEMLPLVGILAALWYGASRVIAGELSLGQFAAFNLYLALLVWPLRVLGQRISTVQRALAAAARVTEILEAEPAVVEAQDARPLPPGAAAVRFDGVRFGYDGAEPILAGFDLEIPRGTSLALVGATGGGKSTVAALLARFYDVQGGSIRIGEIDVRDLRVSDLRHAVALVFEDTFLFSDTVRANLAFGRPDATEEEIEEAARRAGAHEFIVRLPAGYETVLGERGYSLSGGQRQRVAIARALLADPAVLILDDATSAIDATKEHEILGALATLMAGRTTLVIAHRAATIALADKVALLEDGRNAEEGTHTDLLRSSARYRRLLALDLEGAA
jgi:ATP-binding cassette, subfamily B, bacterial